MSRKLFQKIISAYVFILIIVSFKMYISQGSVATQLKDVVGYLITALLQIFHKMCQ